jgi:hypothetical protein
MTNAGMVATGDACMALYKKLPSSRAEGKNFELIITPGAYGQQRVSKNETKPALSHSAEHTAY